MKQVSIGLAVIFSCLFFARAHAQETPATFYFGARFMPTISDFDVRQSNGDLYKTSATLGYGFSGLAGLNLSNHFGLQGVVIYSALAQEYVDELNVKRNINLDYLNIPLLLVLNTNSSALVNLNLVVGPQIGILVKSDFEASGSSEGDSLTAVFGAKSGDLGIAYGAGIDFNILPNLSIDIGYRGVVGLLDISDQSQSLTTDQYYVLDRSNLMTYAAYAGVKLKF